MTKIAMLSPYYNLINCGAEQFAEKIKKSFEKRGHLVDIFSVCEKDYNKKWEDKIANASVGSFCKKYIGIEPSITQMKYTKSIPLVKIRDYDVIWSNAEYLSARYCRHIRDLYDIPFIITSHANKSTLLKSFAKLKPDLLAVLTPDQTEFLKDYDCNIKCIPPGVETDFFKPDKKEKVSEEPIFLSTASLNSAKRIHLIIEAISKLDKGSFVFTSDGPERNKLLKLANEKLGKDRFYYAGSIQRYQLPKIYNKCDFYVNASRSEGLSMSIFEALSCNVPVIYHSDEIRSWQVGDGGLGTNTNDVQNFKTVLCKAMHLNFDDCPRKQALKFDWNKTIEMYEKEIKNL